ncbi:MAG TPA: sialidase family protein [Blastocatellia bacterium]|nr:sialidase family protein [Blastocatellia bacterium]
MWQRMSLAGLMLIANAFALAQTHQHGATAPVDGQYNPFIVSDNRGGFYLAYVERLNNVSNVMLRQSSDGVNFSAPVRVNDRAGDATVRNENPPKVIVGAHGEVYVCWANERGKWKGNIRFARSTDGGKTFSPAITINSDGANEPAGHAFQSIAVDKQGHIYVAWIDERNKRKEDRGGEIWLAVSTNRGKTFSRDHRILADVCECCRTNLQIDSAGNLYLTYRTVPRAGPMYRDIIIAQSLDGGKTFAQTVVSEDKWDIPGCPVAGPSFSFDNTGRLTTIWFMGGGERPGIYYATSTDHGKTFTPRSLLDPQQKIGKRAHTASLADGGVFVAWDDADGKTFSAWGVLYPQKGLLRKSDRREGVAYPVVATNGRIAVVAGMRLATHEIVTFTESLNTTAEADSKVR